MEVSHKATEDLVLEKVKIWVACLWGISASHHSLRAERWDSSIQLEYFSRSGKSLYPTASHTSNLSPPLAPSQVGCCVWAGTQKKNSWELDAASNILPHQTCLVDWRQWVQPHPYGQGGLSDSVDLLQDLCDSHSLNFHHFLQNELLERCD